MKLDMEVWRVHPELTDYEISDHGRVRRRTPRKGAVVGRILRPWMGQRGYLCVRGLPVHVLVLQTFVGERPLGCEARHRDDDKTNNALCNLRWGTHAENYVNRRAWVHV